MPRRRYVAKRKPRVYKKKRKYKRKSKTSKSARQLSNNFALPGISPVKVVTLPYHTALSLGSTVGSQQVWSFKMNDIYDPDYTGTGHQPLGHDQWALYYTQYSVIGAKVTAKFSWAGSTLGDNVMVVGVISDDDTSLPTTVSTKQERYPGCYKLMNPKAVGSTTVTAKFSQKKWFAMKNPTDSHQHIAPMGSSPTLPAYFNVFVQSLDGSTTSSEIACEVNIQYIVRLSEPKDVLGS